MTIRSLPATVPPAAISTPAAANDFKLWFADYVTADAGTGLVHTAPGHGADDYKTGLAHGLAAYAPLDDSGRYIPGVALEGGPQPIDLSGKDISLAQFTTSCEVK